MGTGGEGGAGLGGLEVSLEALTSVTKEAALHVRSPNPLVQTASVGHPTCYQNFPSWPKKPST